MARTKAVLIVGGSGFVGTHLALRLRRQFKVYATYHMHPVRIPGVTYFPLNVGNRNWAKRFVYTVRPDVIIYCGGNNRLEWSEKHHREAEALHTGGPATMLNVSEILAPKFIYLSNCYAFDGNRGNFKETDTALPLTALGKAKIGGENVLKGKSLNHIIVRSSPLIGRGNGNHLSFIDLMRMNLDRGHPIELPDSEYHSFGLVSDFVELLARLADSGIKNKIFHFGGLTRVTHYELGVEFAKQFGYDPKSIIKRQMGDGAKFDYSLNSSVIAENLKVKPLLLQESLNLVQNQLVTPTP